MCDISRGAVNARSQTERIVTLAQHFAHLPGAVTIVSRPLSINGTENHANEFALL